MFQLYERAAADAGRKVAVLPTNRVFAKEGQDEAESTGATTLIKLHGDVDEPDTIVLTRDDYISFRSERSHVEGLLEQLLLTKQILFVGFSLADDNFQRVVSRVSSLRDSDNFAPHAAASPLLPGGASSFGAANNADNAADDADGDVVTPDPPRVPKPWYNPDGEKIGTAYAATADIPTESSAPAMLNHISLNFKKNSGREALWEDLIGFLTFSKRSEYALAACRQAVFLDLVAMVCCDLSPILLCSRYQPVLSDAELAERAFFADFFASVPPQAAATETWQTVFLPVADAMSRFDFDAAAEAEGIVLGLADRAVECCLADCAETSDGDRSPTAASAPAAPHVTMAAGMMPSTGPAVVAPAVREFVTEEVGGAPSLGAFFVVHSDLRRVRVRSEIGCLACAVM